MAVLEEKHAHVHAALTGALIGALVLLPLTTSPAKALTPPAACQFVPELGRFLTPDETETVHPTAQPILPDTFQTGFVYYELRDVKGRHDGSLWFVLEHCPSGQRLLVEAGPREQQVRAKISDMVFGKTGYTMRQIADGLAPLGAQSTLNAPGLGPCPCGHQQFFYGN